MEHLDRPPGTDWIYTFQPTLPIYRMPYPELVTLLRNAFGLLNLRTRAMEAKWVADATVPMVVPKQRLTAPHNMPTTYKNKEPQILRARSGERWDVRVTARNRVATQRPLEFQMKEEPRSNCDSRRDERTRAPRPDTVLRGDRMDWRASRAEPARESQARSPAGTDLRDASSLPSAPLQHNARNLNLPPDVPQPVLSIRRITATRPAFGLRVPKQEYYPATNPSLSGLPVSKGPDFRQVCSRLHA